MSTAEEVEDDYSDEDFETDVSAAATPSPAKRPQPSHGDEARAGESRGVVSSLADLPSFSPPSSPQVKPAVASGGRGTAGVPSWGGRGAVGAQVSDLSELLGDDPAPTPTATASTEQEDAKAAAAARKARRAAAQAAAADAQARREKERQEIAALQEGGEGKGADQDDDDGESPAPDDADARAMHGTVPAASATTSRPSSAAPADVKGPGRRLRTPMPAANTSGIATAQDALEWYAASTRVGIGRRHFAERDWHGSTSVATGSGHRGAQSAHLSDDMILRMVMASVARHTQNEAVAELAIRAQLGLPAPGARGRGDQDADDASEDVTRMRSAASQVGAAVMHAASLPMHLPSRTRAPVAVGELDPLVREAQGPISAADTRGRPAAWPGASSDTVMPQWSRLGQHQLDRHHEVRGYYEPRRRGAGGSGSDRSMSPPPPPPPPDHADGTRGPSAPAGAGGGGRTSGTLAGGAAQDALYAQLRREERHRQRRRRRFRGSRGVRAGAYPDDASGAASSSSSGLSDDEHRHERHHTRIDRLAYSEEVVEDFEDMYRQYVQSAALIGRNVTTMPPEARDDEKRRARRAKVAAALIDSMRELLTDQKVVRMLRRSVITRLERSSRARPDGSTGDGEAVSASSDDDGATEDYPAGGGSVDHGSEY